MFTEHERKHQVLKHHITQCLKRRNPSGLLELAESTCLASDLGDGRSYLFRMKDPQTLAQVLRLQVRKYPEESAKAASRIWNFAPWRALSFFLAGLPLSRIMRKDHNISRTTRCISQSITSAHDEIALAAELGSLENLLTGQWQVTDNLTCLRND